MVWIFRPYIYYFQVLLTEFSPALKLATLLKLSETTSYDLRAAYVFAELYLLESLKLKLIKNIRALRIISERSTKSSTRDLLLEDLASKNKERRGKALTALLFLVSNRACMI